MKTPPRRAAHRAAHFAASLAVVAGLAAGLLPAPPVAACGPYVTDVRFWPQGSAGPWERLVGGDLGILDVGQHRLDGFVAYRHLAGPPLSAADRAALVDLRRPAAGAASHRTARETWIETRRRVPGAAAMTWLSTERWIEERQGDSVSYYAIFNCPPDALRTAAATLEARIAAWGAGSREVAEWLRGQDEVFANCSDGRHVPAHLGGSWPPALRRDRAYQRAAALFYALDYAAAEAAFRAIAEDPRSPWRLTARYLVARCRARAGRYEEAAGMLRRLLEDPEMAAFHDSARGLVDHYRMRYEPAVRHREVRDRLLASPLPPTLGQDWTDYRWTYPGGFDDASLDRWLLVLGGHGVDDAAGEGVAATAAETALRLWRALGTRLWLDAALVTAGAGSATADLEDLAAAAAAVPADAPDGPTVAYHRARLLTLLGRCDEARRQIPLPPPGADADTDGSAADDAADGATAGTTAGDRLTVAQRNRFRTLRAECAEDLSAFLADSQLQPYELGFEDVTWYPIGRPPPPLLLSDRALEVLQGLAVDDLAALVDGGVLAGAPRAQVARVAWTRAAVLGDHAAAAALAPRLGELQPELAADLAAYASAARKRPAEPGEPSATDFAAALLILRHPGLHPDLHRELDRPDALSEIDSLRRNWWCEGELLGPAVEPPDELHAFPPPPFLARLSGDGGAAERRRQRSALAAQPAAAVSLGATVLAWSDARRDDPRVPEALHRLVRATRYGCPGADGYGAVSKAAFDRLHRRYPDSPWTARTPYWFD